MISPKCLTLLLCIGLQPTFGQVKKDTVWIITSSGCKIHNPSPQRNETITWTGDCVNGFAANEGTFTWYRNSKQGSQYTGTMKRGAPHGMGKYIQSNGYVSEGLYERGELNGPGTLTRVENGITTFYYKGDFKDDVRHGKGIEFFFKANGDTSQAYAGSFVEGEREGEGRVREFFEDKVLMIVEGIARKDSFVGNVRWSIYVNYVLIKYYEGGLKNRDMDGFGTLVEGKMKYTGEWKNGKKEGKGKLYYDSALLYDGEWTAGKFDRVGTRYYFDGNKYYGEFKDNKRHGLGQLLTSDGAVYIGEFKNDLFHGYGFFRSPDNKVLSCGRWEKGIVSEPGSYQEITRLMKVYHAPELKALNLNVERGSN